MIHSFKEIELQKPNDIKLDLSNLAIGQELVSFQIKIGLTIC